MKEKTERNRQIQKDYKLGLGGIIGRAQNPPISRQRVHRIVHSTQGYYYKHQDKRLGFLLRYLKVWDSLYKYFRFSDKN